MIIITINHNSSFINNYWYRLTLERHKLWESSLKTMMQLMYWEKHLKLTLPTMIWLSSMRKLSRNMKRITTYLSIIQRELDLKECFNGWEMAALPLKSLKSDTTLLITEECMLLETLRREKSFYMFQRNRSSHSRWQLIPQWERRCTRKAWDRDSFHLSTHSWAPSLCKSAGSQTLSGTHTLISSLRISLTSPFFSLMRRSSGLKEVPSWTRFMKRLKTSSQTTI